MMVEFIAQNVLGWFLFLEICFPSTFFRDGESLQSSPLPTGGLSRGNNPQLLSREGLVEVTWGKYSSLSREGL